MAYTPDAATTTGTQSLTNKTIDGDLNTLQDIPQSAVTGLSTDLGNKVNTSSVGAASGVASLDTNGKVPGAQLPNSIMTYEGLHNVSTNSPALTDASGDAGQVYRVSVAGTRNYGSGNITLDVGDYLIHSGSVWQKADTTDAVSSVAGQTGNVTLTKSDVGLGNVDNTSNVTERAATATLTNKTISGANNTVTNLGVGAIGASGTASSSTFLRGDNMWAAPSGITRVVQTLTESTTLGASGNTDYVTFSGVSTFSDVSLLFADGENNSSTISDASVYQIPWTTVGQAKLATAQKKFGTASIGFNGSTGTYVGAQSSNFAFGTGDFTIECFARTDGPAGTNHGIFQQGTSYYPETLYNTIALAFHSSNKFEQFSKNSASNFGSWSANTWYHIAVSRISGTTRWFIDGTLSLTVTSDTTNYTGTYFALGAQYGGRFMSGYIDEIRISKIGRYSGNFTAPTAQYERDYLSLTLPGASGNTNRYSFRGPFLIGASGAEAINGATGGLTLGATGSAELVSDGTGWRTL